MSAYNYSKYAQDNNQNSGSDSDSGSSGGSGGNDKTVIMSPHGAIEGDLVKIFGNQNQFGQSLAVKFDNAELVDGCLYYDSDKDKYKVFSWKDVVGQTPDEADLSADDANKFLVKTYGTTEKRYELEAAVVPDVDEPAEIGNVIMWYSGNEEFGPKSASVTLAKILTRFGRGAVLDKENIKGWLADTSGDNILRSDLQDRRFAFFEVKKASNQSDRFYHHPIVVDTQTGSQVTVDNSTGGSGSADESDESESGTVGDNEAGEDSSASFPEPVQDFISTCESLGFTDRDRAATLLTDLIGDNGNDLTADMVAEVGGEDAVLDEVAA